MDGWKLSECHLIFVNVRHVAKTRHKSSTLRKHVAVSFDMSTVTEHVRHAAHPARTSYQEGCKQEPGGGARVSHTDIPVTFLLTYLNTAVYI